MKKLAAIFLSLVLLLAVCASASAAVKVPTTIEETGIKTDFKVPEIDMSGAKFLEVSNVKVETSADGYIVTGDFSVTPDWADIYSNEAEESTYLTWDEDKKAFVSDSLLVADDLIISFGGGEWGDDGEIITYWQTSLDMNTLELDYAYYETEKVVYDMFDDGFIGYTEKDSELYVSLNPEKGYFSYDNGSVSYGKSEYSTYYNDYKNDIYLSIYDTYSYYSAPTGENEFMYVEFMPSGKVSYYGFDTIDENGLTLRYSYNRFGQLNSVNYYGDTEDGFVDLYWYNGQWYDWNTDEVVDLDIKVNDAVGPYAEPYVINAPAKTLAEADLNNGSVFEGMTIINGEEVEGYFYDDGIVNAFYTQDGALHDYSYSNFDGSKYVRYGADGTLQYADIYLADGTNYWFYEGKWMTMDAETDKAIVLDGQPKDADLSDMPDLLLPVVAAKPEHDWYPMNTLGLAALSMKDLGISADWHNVAPVDLTTDGTTVFTLVGGESWILGNAYVTVADGNVTVTYELLKGHGYMKEEKLNWFLTKADLTEENLKAESNYAFGEPVSIEEDLKGAETAILFIDSKVTFRQPYFDAYNYSTRYYRNRENWKEYREGLIEMIGE